MYNFLDGNSSPFNVQASAFLLSVPKTKSWVAINQFIQYNELAYLVSRFACNTRMIADASSSAPVSRIKIAVTKT